MPLHIISQYELNPVVACRTILQHFTRDDKRSTYYITQTALHIASDGGHEDVVEVLLAHGADVTKKDEKGFTALMLAIREGHK